MCSCARAFLRAFLPALRKQELCQIICASAKIKIKASASSGSRKGGAAAALGASKEMVLGEPYLSQGHTDGTVRHELPSWLSNDETALVVAEATVDVLASSAVTEAVAAAVAEAMATEATEDLVDATVAVAVAAAAAAAAEAEVEMEMGVEMGVEEVEVAGAVAAAAGVVTVAEAPASATKAEVAGGGGMQQLEELGTSGSSGSSSSSSLSSRAPASVWPMRGGKQARTGEYCLISATPRPGKASVGASGGASVGASGGEGRAVGNATLALALDLEVFVPGLQLTSTCSVSIPFAGGAGADGAAMDKSLLLSRLDIVVDAANGSLLVSVSRQ